MVCEVLVGTEARGEGRGLEEGPCSCFTSNGKRFAFHSFKTLDVSSPILFTWLSSVYGFLSPFFGSTLYSMGPLTSFACSSKSRILSLVTSGVCTLVLSPVLAVREHKLVIDAPSKLANVCPQIPRQSVYSSSVPVTACVRPDLVSPQQQRISPSMVSCACALLLSTIHWIAEVQKRHAMFLDS